MTYFRKITLKGPIENLESQIVLCMEGSDFISSVVQNRLEAPVAVCLSHLKESDISPLALLQCSSFFGFAS